MGPGWLKAYNFSTQFALPELETPRLSALQRCRWPRLRDCKWEGTWLSAGPAWSGPATMDMRWNCKFNVGWTHGKALLLVVEPNPLKGGGPWMTEKSFHCSCSKRPSFHEMGWLTWSALAILLRATSWIKSSCRITWTLQPDETRGSAISGSIKRWKSVLFSLHTIVGRSLVDYSYTRLY